MQQMEKENNAHSTNLYVEHVWLYRNEKKETNTIMQWSLTIT